MADDMNILERVATRILARRTKRLRAAAALERLDLIRESKRAAAAEYEEKALNELRARLWASAARNAKE